MRRQGYALVALLLGACDGTGPVQPESGELVVALRERHGPGNLGVGLPEVTLFLETEREYGCSNFGIDATASVQSRDIVVLAGPVIEREICLTAIGPATYAVELPVSIGEYSLSIESGGVVDEYVLTVTPEALDLEVVSRAFTRPLVLRAWRYPPQSFAVSCDFSKAGGAWCEEFQTALSAAGGFTPFDFDEGEIPYPHGWSAPGGPDWRVTYYRYDDEPDFERAGEVVQTMAERHPGHWLWLVNWLNEVHRSWIIPRL